MNIWYKSFPSGTPLCFTSFVLCLEEISIGMSPIIFILCRGGFRATATSKMECFVIIVNSFQPLTIITKHSILDVAAALDLSLL